MVRLSWLALIDGLEPTRTIWIPYRTRGVKSMGRPTNEAVFSAPVAVIYFTFSIQQYSLARRSVKNVQVPTWVSMRAYYEVESQTAHVTCLVFLFSLLGLRYTRIFDGNTRP